MRKVFIGWGFAKGNNYEVVNCGEFATLKEAKAAVKAAGLKLCEVETEWRK